jgi:pyruvate dehydrogenase E2 component (dihydrolipoamide acetyltransferase)
MNYEFILPDIGEGVVEAEVVRWLVREGDSLKEDDPMVEVMTDKATVQIPSPKPGKVLQLLVAEGAIAQVGKPLIVLDVSNGGGAKTTASRHAQAVSASYGGPAHKAEAPAPEGRVLATPATRRLARELGVDLQGVAGSGPAGRVTKEDVQAAAQGERGAPAVAAARPAAVAAVSATAAAPAAVAAKPIPPAAEERIPLRGLRRRIVEKMHKSKSTAAHFTYVDEVDMTELVSLRERARGAAEARGVKLTFLPFIAKAVVTALKRHPKLNASLDDERGEIVLKKSYHLGIAAATQDGLIVPVVKDADKKSLFDIAAEIEGLAEKARAGKLAPAEVTGSTFTITSLGKLGGLFATPIINHPEVAILGIHEIKKRPVVREGQIAIRDIMLLSVSFDHRVVDGHEGAAFAQAVRGYLEDPHLLFLELV